MNGILRFAER